MSRTQHVVSDHLRDYAVSNAPLTEEEHAHIARCGSCQQLLGQYLAESAGDEKREQ